MDFHRGATVLRHSGAASGASFPRQLLSGLDGGSTVVFSRSSYLMLDELSVLFLLHVSEKVMDFLRKACLFILLQ